MAMHGTIGSTITPDVNFWDLLLFAIEGGTRDQNKSTAGSSAHTILMYLYFIYMAPFSFFLAKVVRYSTGRIASRSNRMLCNVYCSLSTRTLSLHKLEEEVKAESANSGAPATWKCDLSGRRSCPALANHRLDSA